MNKRIENHKYENLIRTYRADYPAYDASLDTDDDGVLVIANGMTVTVLYAFADWNGVPGLDMLYVKVHETGFNIHLVPADLDLRPLTATSRGAKGYEFDTEDKHAESLDDCWFWDMMPRFRPAWAMNDCSGRIAATADGIRCEEHHNARPAVAGLNSEVSA